MFSDLIMQPWESQVLYFLVHGQPFSLYPPHSLLVGHGGWRKRLHPLPPVLLKGSEGTSLHPAEHLICEIWDSLMSWNHSRSPSISQVSPVNFYTWSYHFPHFCARTDCLSGDRGKYLPRIIKGWRLGKWFSSSWGPSLNISRFPGSVPKLRVESACVGLLVRTLRLGNHWVRAATHVRRTVSGYKL